VLADKQSGQIALYKAEYLVSDFNRGLSENIDDHKEFSKFLIKLQPKILCILDITSNNDCQLLASAYVRCPGPNIVSGSPQ